MNDDITVTEQREPATTTALTMLPFGRPDRSVMTLPTPRIMKSLQHWADVITRTTGEAVEGIINLGRMLIMANKALDHGEWEKLFKSHKCAVKRPVPFTVATARMLMSIAKNPTLSNRNYIYDLPPSWPTLYRLTLIPEPQLHCLLSLGKIHAEMSCVEARLLREICSPSVPRPKRRKLPIPLPRYCDDPASLREAEAALRAYCREIAEHLRSGVVWVPPFPNEPEPKPRPVKVIHRCECGHEHKDRRTTR